VTATGSPFTDPALVQGPLYASVDRLARRTGALHRARTGGLHAGQVIADLAAGALAPDSQEARVADIGCGRGTSTRMLAQRLPAAKVVAVDLSAAMVVTARDRLARPATAGFVRADFRCLPLTSDSCDVVVAAFCLYHCACPGQVIEEIARCLRPGGTAILATKSNDSYRELDQLVAVARLDPGALSRPGLYEAAHSGNLAALTSAQLHVQQVIHHTHRFTFASLADAAEYLATAPKYQFPTGLAGDSAAIAAALRAELSDGPVTTTSTVTYVTATRPPRNPPCT
jgi:ubiquinone/menaquinone biosynthesis C-methylase UbiE